PGGRRPETGGDPSLLAHVGALLGAAVPAAVARVIELRAQIDPHHSIAWATRLGLGFARELFLGERHRRPRRRGRAQQPPALRDEYLPGLAAFAHCLALSGRF